MKAKSKKIGIVVILGAILLVGGIELGIYVDNLAMRPGDFEYQVISETEKTCRLTDYNGPKTVEMNIPEEVNGYWVVELGIGLFSSERELTGEVKIPKGVTYIGEQAFFQCEGLYGEVVFPEGLTGIGKEAFSGCKGLKKIVLPDNLQKIEWKAFEFCTGLEGDLDIPAMVTEISWGTFQGCSGLNGTLTLPEGLTAIGERAFNDCNFSGDLRIPDSVTYIGSAAFGNTYKCGTLALPEKDVEIDYGAFFGCGFEGELRLPEGNSEIEENAFKSCNFSGILIIPERCDMKGRLPAEVFDVSDYEKIIDNRDGKYTEALKQGAENVEIELLPTVELKSISFDEGKGTIYGQIEANWKSNESEELEGDASDFPEAYLVFTLLRAESELVIEVPLWKNVEELDCYDFEVSVQKFADSENACRYALNAYRAERLSEEDEIQYYSVSDEKYNLEGGELADEPAVYMSYIKGGVLNLRKK